MKEIGSREFQLTYQRLKEPVKVVALGSTVRVIGYFYPGPIDPKLAIQPTLELSTEPRKSETS